MAIDDHLLAEARGAEERVRSLEQEIRKARTEYERAVRRIHVEGASLREIAEALGLSHQRVHQLIGLRPQAWWAFWRGGSRETEPPGGCSFCGAAPKAVAKLMAGPGLYICDGCVRSAKAALGGAEGPIFTALADGSRKRCSFCGRRGPDHPRATASGHQICRSCLDLAERIMVEGE
ncbi:hypothetical protein KXS07_30150 [Inquilinus limosus]|uniref:ClpX C4-type zinc finger protein n=1 Tax=Inquilinus limosus TaxID=171674 RepID=UPI003F15FE94